MTNNEIKEILEYVLSLTYGNENAIKGINKVEDYITNLQEQLHQASLDIQELTEKDIGCPSWCDKLTNLQEKYNEYKNLYFSEHKVKEDYKSRCERAIQREMELSYLCDTQPDEELLKILQGEDNE